MKYISTRGSAPAVEFESALLTGLATDGGLYVPESWPQLSPQQLRDLRGKPYVEVAFAVVRPFVGEVLPDRELRQMIEAAYAGFAHPAVTPLKQMDANHWILELFRGTLTRLTFEEGLLPVGTQTVKSSFLVRVESMASSPIFSRSPRTAAAPPSA